MYSVKNIIISYNKYITIVIECIIHAHNIDTSLYYNVSGQERSYDPK